jgi:MerR family transcriptional regulator, light-induced transcriptional regulator
MNDIGAAAHEPATGLTIGDLAEQTGLTPAVLRAWETRHGFPVPTRLASGHRRFRAADVDLVRQVVRRRDAGVRLDVAIAEARGAEPPGAPSVFAELRRRHPHLPVHRLRKSTLIAMSWAIEDECGARADRPVLIGSFERARYFRAAEARWEALARIAHHAVALAWDFPDEPADGAADAGLELVRLDRSSPMAREWAVISDGPGLSACLSAWELPGQSVVRDRDRLFEAVWTVHPAVVRDATAVAAGVAAAAGSVVGAAVRDELRDGLRPVGAAVDATALYDRMLVYADRFAAPAGSR